MRRGRSFLISMGMIVMLFMGLLVNAHFSGGASAGPSVTGDPSQANVKAVIEVNGNSRLTRIVYFRAGSHTTGGANTPVVSDTFCNVAGDLHYAELKFTGTLAGVAPTLVIHWYNSLDNGATWTAVGSWTTINATVTPAKQTNTLGDHPEEVLMNANTPVVTPALIYGDCWRADYTMGAAGTGNFSLIGADK